MADELETRTVYVAERAKGLVGDLVLGAGIDQRALGAGEGQGVAVVFQQVLADLGPYGFDQVAQVAQDGVVATDGLARLQQVVDTDQAEQCGTQRQWPQAAKPGQAR